MVQLGAAQPEVVDHERAFRSTRRGCLLAAARPALRVQPLHWGPDFEAGLDAHPACALHLKGCQWSHDRKATTVMCGLVGTLCT